MNTSAQKYAQVLRHAHKCIHVITSAQKFAHIYWAKEMNFDRFGPSYISNYYSSESMKINNASAVLKRSCTSLDLSYNPLDSSGPYSYTIIFGLFLEVLLTFQ